ncbi:YraN family protein [Pseudomonas sp. EL_65y_Pfl2_R95]|uniref:YraN family protein n=1 Tax=Pseudomonas sp. EL_65y_Pfl2_R95 TaxID=3088698 RepID=UPI004040824A
MDRSSSQSSGNAAEAMALEHLEHHGLHLIAKNWRCRLGELDLVMLDIDTVVFVEVRFRHHSAWGGATESVDARKRTKLTHVAMAFLQQESRWNQHPCRFDVVAINAASKGKLQLNWIRNAFDS